VAVLVLEEDAVDNIYGKYTNWQKKHENKFAELIAEKVAELLVNKTSVDI
jgi:hypothetical protein